MQNLIFLQTDGLVQMMPLLLIFIVFWFFIIRPQMKKQKAQAKFGEQLQKGQEVITSSGVFGKINKIEGEIVHLEIATKTVIRITRSAISKELTESLASATNKSPVETK